MNYKILSLWLTVCMAIMIGCCEEQSEKIVEKIVEKSTLQDIVDSSNEGDTIDLASYGKLGNYSATVNKTLTIKNGALSNSTLTIEADDVTLSGLKDLKITTSAKLGDGKLTINDSDLSDLLLCGGGSNSIYILGNSFVENLTMDYLNVRTLLGGEVNVANLTVKQDAIIQAETNKIAKVNNMILEGFSALVNVGGGTQEGRAGGILNIEEISFSGENAQINLNGDINVNKISADSTSKIITDNHKLEIDDNNISVNNGAAALTIVKDASMTPINLMVLGLESSYIVGDELQKSELIVMEENELSENAVIYKQGAASAEPIDKVWVKKTDFSITIDNEKSLKFTKAGSVKVVVSCGQLTYSDDVMVVNPNEPLGDVTISLSPEDPQISLYIAEDGQSYKRITGNTVSKPKNPNCVLMAIADVPDGYSVSDWMFNGTSCKNMQITGNGIMLMLPLTDIVSYLNSENTVSVTVMNTSGNKYLSGNANFNYE